MRVTDLYGTLGGTVYVVGTGPSMRLFDVGVLRGQPTIALNQAWRYWAGKGHAPTLGLTVHPELILEYDAYPAAGKPAVQWVTKPKPPMPLLTADDPRFYVFEQGRDDIAVVGRDDAVLYQAQGIQATGVDLAARMGASVVVLVGVDMGHLGDDHHGHAQHVRFHGRPSDDVYASYRKCTAKVRTALRPRGVTVLTMGPLLGVDAANEDYLRQLKELALEPLPPAADTSPYVLPTRKAKSRPPKPTKPVKPAYRKVNRAKPAGDGKRKPPRPRHGL